MARSAEEKLVQSQLFTLRVWVEDVGDGRREIRGQIKQIPSAEIAYFREWAALQDFLELWLGVEKAGDIDG